MGQIKMEMVTALMWQVRYSIRNKGEKYFIAL